MPTNSRVLVMYQGWVSKNDVDRPRLRQAGGAEVETSLSTEVLSSLTTMILTPSVPLTPGTTYEVTSSISQVPCSVDPAMDYGVPQCHLADAGTSSAVIATFTTGEAADTLAPAWPGTVQHNETFQQCMPGNCCSGATFFVQLAWPVATDAPGPVYYELRANDVLVDSALRVNQITIQLGCAAPGPLSAKYSLVAVDAAGNRSLPATTIVNVTCPAADGGVVPVPTDPSRGCSASGATGSPSGLVLVVASVLVLGTAVRRRRRVL